jgi:hypothetical protein
MATLAPVPLNALTNPLAAARTWPASVALIEADSSNTSATSTQQGSVEVGLAAGVVTVTVRVTGVPLSVPVHSLLEYATNPTVYVSGARGNAGLTFLDTDVCVLLKSVAGTHPDAPTDGAGV